MRSVVETTTGWEDEKARRGNFCRIICQFESLGEMHRRRRTSARPLADVFLRGIGSIPDRFSNESRGVECRKDERDGTERGRRGTSRSKGWSSPRVAGANSNNQARLGERHRTVVTRANPKYCYPPGAFTSFGTTGFLAVRREKPPFLWKITESCASKVFQDRCGIRIESSRVYFTPLLSFRLA